MNFAGISALGAAIASILWLHTLGQDQPIPIVLQPAPWAIPELTQPKSEGCPGPIWPGRNPFIQVQPVLDFQPNWVLDFEIEIIPCDSKLARGRFAREFLERLLGGGRTDS